MSAHYSSIHVGKIHWFLRYWIDIIVEFSLVSSYHGLESCVLNILRTRRKTRLKMFKRNKYHSAILLVCACSFIILWAEICHILLNILTKCFENNGNANYLTTSIRLTCRHWEKPCDKSKKLKRRFRRKQKIKILFRFMLIRWIKGLGSDMKRTDIWETTPTNYLDCQFLYFFC